MVGVEPQPSKMSSSPEAGQPTLLMFDPTSQNAGHTPDPVGVSPLMYEPGATLTLFSVVIRALVKPRVSPSAPVYCSFRAMMLSRPRPSTCALLVRDVYDWISFPLPQAPPVS